MEGTIRTSLQRTCRSRAGRVACLLIFAAKPVLAAVEMTPWGDFDFPSPVRTQREAQLMQQEARVPIVIAIRFLAAADTQDAAWVNHYLACGTKGEVRKDLPQAMVRASTLMAHRLVEDLEAGRVAAADLLAGRPAGRPVRYAGPVAIVLEPVRISAMGDAIPPPITIEPHLRILVAASVPRCASEATGAFGQLGELASGFMITASPALELGWPTYSATALGQRVVMATENFLTDGFCCGQESALGLESLLNVYDYRDYKTKYRLRNTLSSLGQAKQRTGAWAADVRDAFGVPDRFSEIYLRSLRYGSGRLAAAELLIWPARSETLAGGAGNVPAEGAARVTVADFLLALAWHAHVRADLISPAILESYDPDRKYSFVGWPEEFRDPTDAAGAEDNLPARAGGKVLEVFGTARKFSFVGEPEAIQENIEFAFAAWKTEIDYSERHETEPFRARYAPGGDLHQPLEVILQGETDAAKRRRPQTYQPAFGAGAVAANLAAYDTAIKALDRKPALPLEVAGAGAATPAKQVYSLRWGGNAADIAAGDATELRAGLVRLYRDTFRGQLGESLPANP